MNRGFNPCFRWTYVYTTQPHLYSLARIIVSILVLDGLMFILGGDVEYKTSLVCEEFQSLF